MKKLILTVIVLSLGAVGFYFYDSLQAPVGQGEVTIIIVDQNDDIIYQENHSFQEEDTLFEIMNETFTLSCASPTYQPTECTTNPILGTVILGIDDMTTNWTTDYIAIYVNDVYSSYGIDNVVLTDGDTYRFEYTLVEELTP